MSTKIKDINTQETYLCENGDICLATDAWDKEGWMIAVVLDGPTGRGTRLEYTDGDLEDFLNQEILPVPISIEIR